MVPTRISPIIRALTAVSSRRSLLGMLTGGLLALTNLQVGADSSVEVARKKRRRNKKKRRNKRCAPSRRCRKQCCRQGLACRDGVCRRPRTQPPPHKSRVRRNLHALEPDGPELGAFARGVAVMQDRAGHEPTSWAFQARIHAESCQHRQIHFLAWHRMYLYWFERILRQASGDPTLTLPYWDYSDRDQRVLPAPFLDSDNVLYEATRSDPVRRGDEPDEDDDWIFDASRALATQDFEAIGNSLGFGGGPDVMGQAENAPHNHIHNWVGGLMESTQTAASDPIFWIHHANIDRLWEAWLRRGGRRANPTSGPFLTTTFDFFNDQGTRVQMTGQQILDTVDQLGYRYDDQPASRTRSTAADSSVTATAGRRDSTIIGATAKGEGLTLGSRPVEVSIPVRAAAGASFQAAKRGGGVRTTLAIDGVAGGGVPGVTHAVHVGATSRHPSPRDRSFVGALGLFGVQPWDHGAGHGRPTANLRFDVTHAIAAGGEAQVTVTLVPLDFTGSGRRPGGTWATIERMVLTVEGAGVSETKQAKPKRSRQRDNQRSGTERPKRDQQPNSQPKDRSERPARRRNATDPKRTANRKRKQSGQIRQPRTETGGAHHAAAIPGQKQMILSVDPATGATDVAETGHARH